MKTSAPTHTKAASTPSFTPAPTGLLQRQGAYGGKIGLGGECTTCQQKPFGLQHEPVDESEPPAFSPSLGHNFGQVQVHWAASERIQPKLTVNQPGDKYEQEADRVAEQVMRMPEPSLQRQVDDDEEEEEELLQTKPLVQRRVASGDSEAPPIVHEVLRSPGRLLDPSMRQFMGSRFGHDFSQIRIHVNEQATSSAQAVNARAYTVGQDVVFGSGEYAPGTSSGQRLLAHELTHVVQQNRAETIPKIQRDPLPEAPAVEEVPAAQKTDSELVHGIIDTQLAILEGWETALDNFDKVLTSASDKSAKPNFKAVVVSFLEDKVMSEMISRSKVTGAGDAFALLGKLEAEVKRAAKAKESATLQDFFVQHRSVIGRLRQSVHSLRDDFLARVRITEERMTEEGGADEYGVMRVHLVEMLERLDFRLKISSPEDLFGELSEQWIRQSTIPGSLGTTFPAFLLIRIEDDFTVRNAEIRGPGGQKIAEQLLRDSPEGVDVFDMKVPRRILYHKKNKSLHSAIVRLDENNNLMNEGSYIEGNYMPIYRMLRSSGLPPTKNLSGD